MSIMNVPEDWKGTKRIRTPGGEQEMLCLSEQGLYFFLGRSDKPKALPYESATGKPTTLFVGVCQGKQDVHPCRGLGEAAPAERSTDRPKPTLPMA